MPSARLTRSVRARNSSAPPKVVRTVRSLRSMARCAPTFKLLLVRTLLSCHLLVMRPPLVLKLLCSMPPRVLVWTEWPSMPPLPSSCIATGITTIPVTPNHRTGKGSRCTNSVCLHHICFSAQSSI